ncbi:isoleucine--tRNA ligase [Candidatus Saccharibacteria bacterium]|nr:isoleucine--tRNA ligase [Candidatus Saccharibacteria bacterium]
MKVGIFLFNKKGDVGMKYKYGVRRRASEYEKALVDFWKKEKTFEKSVDNRDAKNSYVFYDGPPFITGMPHHGTLLSSVVKDAVPRYWTMNGKRVERRWGWDCHGLPAENFVEKQLGITDRRDIGTKISLEDYIIKARESMVANSETWRGTIDRIGRWVDFDNCYRTMNKDFMESVWWAFKTLYEKGKIYEGAKVLMYDTKFATPVSKAEVTMDNDAYQTVTDPSAYVKFMINDGEFKGVYLMAWTTTPWTLFGNMALAVNKKLTYALYQDAEKRKFIALKGKAQGDDWKELDTFKGEKLVGLSYEPLFLGETNTPLVEWQKFEKNYYEAEEKNAHKVYAGDFVGAEEGTGIVHIAPAYGEDDFELCKKAKVPIIDVLDDNGFYLDGADIAMKEAGVRPDDDGKIHAWDMNKIIAKCLEGDDKPIYKIEYIQHEYPFNPRSKQRIMYRAIPSWFFDIEGNKSLMLEKNEGINWFPEHLKHGRFAKNIEQAPDWNLSRDRFWATAMPVWKGDKGTLKVVGSYDELYELSGVRLEDYHRPWIDEVEFDIDGEHFTRVDKVLDCWFESGSMPFAQLHYPFENKEKFEANYPADFIVEYVGQVRAWFYYVHAVNTALFGDKAYKNVITTGTLAGNDGRKMSKSLGNYTDPNVLMDQYSADALRFVMLSSPVLAGEDFALIDKDVSDTARKLTMIWNVYDFFTMYAEVDGWEFKGNKLVAPKELKNPLDAWIIARLYQLRDEITEGMEKYNLPAATAGILPFVDDLSNWFVRRSRRRFWKSESGSDKAEAYETLHFVLSYLALILAPFTPFLAEELWQNMMGGESVHLQDWPKAGKIDEVAITKMADCRAIITEGLALRMERNDEFGQIKVRQPLASLKYGGDKLDEFYEQIIAEEVNVKSVAHGKKLELDKKLTDELREEGFVRELIRFVQSARKKAGLNVDDRIKLSVSCEVPEAHVETLKNEVLAVELTKENYAYDEIVKIDGENVTISLEKV